jgi:hypothetical protein
MFSLAVKTSFLTCALHNIYTAYVSLNDSVRYCRQEFLDSINVLAAEPKLRGALRNEVTSAVSFARHTLLCRTENR